MTDINNQIIYCPNCQASITVDELGEHVNAKPDVKKQAIEEQVQLWSEVYDRSYPIRNVVFCSKCDKVSHFDDWASINNSSSSSIAAIDTSKTAEESKEKPRSRQAFCLPAFQC